MNINVPPARLPDGTATLTNFFDDYPRFYETSETTPQRDRLNMRYEAIFGQNRDVFQGARVLDIASHDGRWSLAALKSGASEVVGIEGREDLVTHSNQTFAHYGIESDRYRFVAGDIFEVVAAEEMKFDVVMCLGFLYHTLRYNELFHHIRRMRPHHLIIDTGAIKRKEPLVKLRVEDVAQQRNAIADRYAHADGVLSGRPSVKGLEMMLAAFDFELEGLSDWAALFRDNPEANDVNDYRKGNRVTARVRAVEPGTLRMAERTRRAARKKGPANRAKSPARPANTPAGAARAPGVPASKNGIRPARGAGWDARAKSIARDLAPPLLTRWISSRRRSR